MTSTGAEVGAESEWPGKATERDKNAAPAHELNFFLKNDRGIKKNWI